MEARQISVQLRRDPREIAERHSQANPLTLSCTLARGETVEQNLSLYAELHTSRTPASVPLAASGPVAMATGGTGPWELDFSGAQMNQTVLPGEDVEFWLVVYAVGSGEVYTLATIRLTLQYDNVSQVTPPPPTPALFLDLGGTQWKTGQEYAEDDIVALSGSIYVCAAANTSSTANEPGVGANWSDYWTLFSGGGGGGSGDVTGPASSVNNTLPRFSGTTGKVLKGSSVTVSDTGGLLADTLAISTTPTGAGGTGIFRYDTGEKVPEVGIDGITLKIGVQEYVRVYNDTASTLTKGQVVYISGAQGNRVAVRLADASVEATSAGTLGLVAQSITAGSEGFVQVSGPMYNLATTGLTAGALLYLSETAGQWTQTEPAAPAHGVRIGYVQRVDATVGSVFVKIDNGYELGELHNVSDSANNITAFLVKNSSTNLWTSRTATEARSDLQLGTLATQSGTFSGASSGTNTGDVTLSGTGYLSLTGQALTASPINLASHVTGTLPIASGGTGATTAANALTSLGAYAASNPAGYTSNTGTVTSVTGTAPISVSNNTTTPAITVATFGTSNSGVVPSSGGGTTNFLRADGEWAAPPGGAGISDGDKGDITVSGSGATWTIDANAVTYAKMQAVSAASRLLGRGTAGTSAVREISLGTGLSMSGDTLNATPGSASVDVQTFEANGTWNNPSPSVPRPVFVRIVAGGGGGASGRCDATGDRFGGGGGAGGGILEYNLMSNRLGATEPVTVGAGGTGAGGVSAGSSGNNGGPGGNSSFAGLTALGGAGGIGGTATGGAGGAGLPSVNVILFQLFASVSGGSSSVSGTPAAPTSITAPIPGSGGAGGGVNASNNGQNGGRGSSMRIGREECMPQTQTIGGNAGAAGAAGQSGGSPGVAANNFPVGLGGSGGGAGTTTTGGAGGAGGFPGGGGGGGGAGTTLSGGGGNGGAGLVQVITYL